MERAARALGLLGIVLVGCRRPPARDGDAQPTTATAPERGPSVPPAARAVPSSASPPALPPLEGTTPLVALEVPGFRRALVSIPHGATGSRPVLVALHGNYDRPEWQCSVWRSELGTRGFILCPRGSPRTDAPASEDRWTYVGQRALEDEVVAGLSALHEQYPGHVDRERPVLVAFSLGAILGARLLGSPKFDFARAVLIEGGYESWSAARARALGPGARLLFACGQAGCMASAGNAAKITARAGVETRVVSGGTAGHTYGDAVARAVGQEWEWLVANDRRWSGEP